MKRTYDQLVANPMVPIVNSPNMGAIMYYPTPPDIAGLVDVKTILEELPWEREKVRAPYSKGLVDARRFTVALGDSDKHVFRYAGQEKRALPWTPHVLRLKEAVEALTGQRVNFALCNYYPNGQSIIGPHSDDVRHHVAGSRIISLSLGATRDFVLHPIPHNDVDKRKRKVVALEHGSVLTMDLESQVHWKHSIPKRAKVKEPRVNITFRLLEVKKKE